MDQPSTSDDGRVQQVYSELVKRWPARRQQINELVKCFTNRTSGCDVLVSGLSGTGKTSIVRDVLEQLCWTGAYVLCSESAKPRHIYSSILSQLSGAKRKRSSGFAPEHSCDNCNDFLLKLPACCPSSGPAKCIILDQAHRLGKTAVLGTIQRARELSRANISIVLISTMGWGSGAFHSGPRPQACITFPAYGREQVQQILLATWQRQQQQRVAEHAAAIDSDASVYTTFLSSVVIPSFWQLSRRLTDLQVLARLMWPAYTRPLEDGMVARPVEAAGFAVLHKRVQPAVKKLLATFEPGAATLAMPVKLPGQSGPAGPEADVELPHVAKLLLLAAYLASRNKATTDKVVFEGGKAGRGRRSATAQDRQAEAAKEAQLKGPHNFPLQRLLLILRVLARNEAQAQEEVTHVPGGAGAAVHALAGPGGGGGLDSCDVLMQVSSLVSMKLLQQVGDDPLDGPRYSCNAPDELVERLCAELHIRMANYLRLA